MVFNLIIGLVELEYKEEKVGCKKISVGVYILKNTHEEGHAYIFKKLHKYYERMMDKRMMRMKGKEWGEEEEKRHDERLKERIGGWKYKWRNSAPLV